MPYVTHKRIDAITCVYFTMRTQGMHVRFSYAVTKTDVGEVNMKQNPFYINARAGFDY